MRTVDTVAIKRGEIKYGFVVKPSFRKKYDVDIIIINKTGEFRNFVPYGLTVPAHNVKHGSGVNSSE